MQTSEKVGNIFLLFPRFEEEEENNLESNTLHCGREQDTKNYFYSRKPISFLLVLSHSHTHTRAEFESSLVQMKRELLASSHSSITHPSIPTSNLDTKVDQIALKAKNYYIRCIALRCTGARNKCTGPN